MRAVVEQARSRWNTIVADEQPSDHNPHEAHWLRLDCTKAHQQLDWFPVWNTPTAIERTIDWYRTFYEQDHLLTPDDLSTYVQQARAANLTWTR